MQNIEDMELKFDEMVYSVDLKILDSFFQTFQSEPVVCEITELIITLPLSKRISIDEL